jgi:glutamate transport system permease protein
MSSSVLYDVPGPKARRRQRIGSMIGAVVLAALLGLVLWRLASEGTFAAGQWEPFTRANTLRAIVNGLVATLQAAILAIVLALVWGTLLAVGRISDRVWIRFPATAIIEFFRATPVLLLIFFLFFGFSSNFDAFGELVGLGNFGTLGPLVTALMLYNGSVLAEIFRAGINAVPRGQSEAAYAIGLRKTQAMRIVLIPQAVRIMLPAIVSQSVVALKDTALGFIIGYTELLRAGRSIFLAFNNIIPTVIVIAIIYISMCVLLSQLATWLEGRQSRAYGRAAVEAAESAVTNQ